MGLGSHQQAAQRQRRQQDSYLLEWKSPEGAGSSPKSTSGAGDLGRVGGMLSTDLFCVTFHRAANSGEPEDVCGCVPRGGGGLGDRGAK